MMMTCSIVTIATLVMKACYLSISLLAQLYSQGTYGEGSRGASIWVMPLPLVANKLLLCVLVIQLYSQGV